MISVGEIFENIEENAEVSLADFEYSYPISSRSLMSLGNHLPSVESASWDGISIVDGSRSKAVSDPFDQVEQAGLVLFLNNKPKGYIIIFDPLLDIGIVFFNQDQAENFLKFAPFDRDFIFSHLDFSCGPNMDEDAERYVREWRSFIQKQFGSSRMST